MTDLELPLTSGRLRSLRGKLLRWYDEHRRDLPWRHDNDPYRVWLSEIMLQQTRVAAVLDHYARFLRRFPTVHALAAAREASVLAAWSGLGYYHRARRMHQAAKIIVRERHGEFPRSFEQWLKLPGIGRYTAAAIASIAFGEAVAVVDGNVERVMQRLFGRERQTPRPRNPGAGEAAFAAADAWRRGTAWSRAQSLLDHRRPGDFNQAMMELGATVCLPRAPLCLLCPVTSFCKTRGAGKAIAIPARKRQELHYALARRDNTVLLVRRSGDASLMAGMWELPAIYPEQINGDIPLLRLRHSITDTDYQVSVFAVAADRLPDPAAECKWSTAAQYARLPLTGLARKILRHATVASSPVADVSK